MIVGDLRDVVPKLIEEIKEWDNIPAQKGKLLSTFPAQKVKMKKFF